MNPPRIALICACQSGDGRTTDEGAQAALEQYGYGDASHTIAIPIHWYWTPLLIGPLPPGLVGTALYIGAVAVQTRINPALGPAAKRYPWAHLLVLWLPSFML